MNRIDAFFIGISLLIVWFTMVYLLPNPVLAVIYLLIASGAVGWWIGKFIIRLIDGSPEKKIDFLCDIINRSNDLNLRLIEDLSIYTNYCETLQIKIDGLMGEFCPEQMTPEQAARWKVYKCVVNSTFKGTSEDKP